MFIVKNDTVEGARDADRTLEGLLVESMPTTLLIRGAVDPKFLRRG
jgi:hypothetical protein